jgi:hypothetical protein
MLAANPRNPIKPFPIQQGFELYAAAFQQLASICAVLGGLAFTAAAALLAADVSRAVATGNAAYADQVTRLNWIPSLVLVAGVLLFVTSVGASGWIASRKLGFLTGLVAVAGSIALMLMLWVFGDVA